MDLGKRSQNNDSAWEVGRCRPQCILCNLKTTAVGSITITGIELLVGNKLMFAAPSGKFRIDSEPIPWLPVSQSFCTHTVHKLGSRLKLTYCIYPFMYRYVLIILCTYYT